MTETLVKEKSVKLFAPVIEGIEQRSASEGETSPLTKFISTQADDWLKDALDRSAATRKEYEKTAEKLSEQKASYQLQETIDGYMAQIDAQNKGMKEWEIQTVQSSGYRVNGRRIERTAIIDSTLMGNVKKTQTVAMYEDFKTARPEAELSASDGQNAQNAMERILLAMDMVKDD